MTFRKSDDDDDDVWLRLDIVCSTVPSSFWSLFTIIAAQQSKATHPEPTTRPEVLCSPSRSSNWTSMPAPGLPSVLSRT